MRNTRSKIISVALACWCLAGSAAAATVKAVLKAPSGRTQAAPFLLKDAGGKTARLTDYRGKVILLNFWATDCGGCRIEIPWLVAIDQDFRNKNVAVIGISMDIPYDDLKNSTEAWAKVTPFVASHQITYPILMGEDETGRAYNIQALPATYLIDTDGRIAATYVGLIDGANVRANIESLLGEHSARH